MYNYNNINDYYNYKNNNYNKPIYTEDANSKKLYDPYAGFIKGNMFPNLYNSYKMDKPIDIKSTDDQTRLMIMLDALEFATIDLNLYLDVYQNDKDILELFNQYRTETNNLRKEYESLYAPLLTSSDALMAYPWAWDNGPWPWENK